MLLVTHESVTEPVAEIRKYRAKNQDCKIRYRALWEKKNI